MVYLEAGTSDLKPNSCIHFRPNITTMFAGFEIAVRESFWEGKEQEDKATKEPTLFGLDGMRYAKYHKQQRWLYEIDQLESIAFKDILVPDLQKAGLYKPEWALPQKKVTQITIVMKASERPAHVLVTPPAAGFTMGTKHQDLRAKLSRMKSFTVYLNLSLFDIAQTVLIIWLSATTSGTQLGFLQHTMTSPETIADHSICRRNTCLKARDTSPVAANRDDWWSARLANHYPESVRRFSQIIAAQSSKVELPIHLRNQGHETCGLIYPNDYGEAVKTHFATPNSYEQHYVLPLLWARTHAIKE